MNLTYRQGTKDDVPGLKALAIEIMNNARHIYESLGFKIVREIDQRLGKRYWLCKLDLDEVTFPHPPHP